MAAILTDRFRVVLAENFRQRVALGEDPQFVDGNGNRTVSPVGLYLFLQKQMVGPITNQLILLTTRKQHLISTIK